MNNDRKKSIVIGIIIFLILLIIGLLILILLRKDIKKPTIVVPSDIIYMKVGQIKMLPYSLSDDADVNFESSNVDIAKIDRQGYIYAYKVGTTTISVFYANDTSNSFKCTVAVVEGGNKVPNAGEEIQNGNPENQENQNDEKPRATCKLSVSKDGMITSTSKNAIRYGFDKNNIDSMEISKHILDIKNKEETDREGWTYYRIRYYVENEDGVKGSCTIVVIKKCNGNVCVYEKN